jgi:putative redox protein
VLNQLRFCAAGRHPAKSGVAAVTMTRVKWIEGNSFLGVSQQGRSIVMSGADGPGVSPMQLLLLALGGCAAIDVVDILRKQRQPLTGLEVQVSGERGSELPKPWETAQVHFILFGDGLDPRKVARAVDLSVEKYISHGFELRPAAAGIQSE